MTTAILRNWLFTTSTLLITALLITALLSGSYKNASESPAVKQPAPAPVATTTQQPKTATAEPHASEEGKAPSGRSIFHLTGQWTSHDGKAATLSDYKDQILVISMVYTSCKYICPRITSDMLQIQRALNADQQKRVRFLLFSFDPQKDTPTALKHYYQERKLDAQWTLFTSNDDTVLELAAVLGIKFKPDGKGDFSHSNIISVIDRAGVIQHQQIGIGQDPKPAIAALQGLLK